MKSAIPFILLLVFSCSGPSDNKDTERLIRLQEAFEKQWGENTAASDSVRIALAALPGRNEYILYCRAWKLALEGKKPAALKTADSLVMGYPAFEKGTFLRANLRLENRDTSGSLADFDRCLKRNSAFFECRMNRGSLYFSRKMPDLAYLDFKEAVKLRPENASAIFNLGNAQYALGQVDSACLQWKKAENAGFSSAKGILQKFCLSGR